MSKCSIIFYILVIGLTNNSCNHKLSPNEGSIVFSYTNLSRKQINEDRIWFKDSVIIYEMKVFFSKEFDTDTGRTTTNSYDVYKYTYLDLRTLRCQDYRHFSDTATMFCNYILKPDESIGGWDFYSEKSKHSIYDKVLLLPVPDTILDKQGYKRMKFVDTFGLEFTYYLNCKAKKNIFYFYPGIENRFPGCKLTRYEVVDLNSVLPKTFSEYKLAEKKLSPEEDEIFNKWKRNAVETKLPLITNLKEAKKMSFQREYSH